jgi:hypothetical protein
MRLQSIFLLLLTGLFAGCKTPPESGNNRIAVVAGTPEAGIPKDFQWVIYDYGSPPEPSFAKAQKEVWKRYGVEISGFGCEVTEDLMRAIKLHNDSLFALLQYKYPGVTEDWVLGEMQNYVTTQKGIEATIKPYLEKRLRNCVEPLYYTDISWQPVDTSGKAFLVKVFLENPETGERQPTKIELKVIPATNTYLVRNDAGNWVEP